MREATIKDVPLKTTFQFVWSMVHDSKSMLACMIFCTVAFSIVEIAIPATGKHLFDYMTQTDIADGIDASEAWRIAWTFCGLMMGYWVFRYTLWFIWLPFEIRYMQRLAQRAFERVQSFSTAWFNDTFAGVTVRNITRGMGALDGVLESSLTQFFPTFMIIIGTGIYMSVGGYGVLGIGFILYFVLFMTVTGAISLKIVAPANRAANEADSKLGGTFADAISCNAAIKSFGTERQEQAHLRDVLNIWSMRKLAAWRRGLSNGVLQTLFLTGMRGGLVLFSVWEWSHGRMTPGDVMYFFMMTGIVSSYMRDFGAQLRQLQNNVNDLDPVAAYMQMIPAIVDVPNAPEIKVTQGTIDFDNVRFGYKPELMPLFDNMSVTIKPGENIALVGRSGSGKTSFVKLVQRLYDIQGGEIRIDGQNIAKVTQESLHQSIALVPQEPVLFHRTLAQNIAYAKPEASMDVIRQAAKDAFIDDFILSLPEAYETLVGERGVKLSGGERQRVAIARALVADRPILILDEATSSLDSVSETLIQQALEKLMQNRTTLVIAHRLSTIRKADRILVFAGGKIVEEGSHEQLLAKNGQYRTLYDAQVDGLIAVD
ncbi:MAG TPA: ABC transporter ATP-binding protein [Alphaproteobacteria bacterium]